MNGVIGRFSCVEGTGPSEDLRANGFRSLDGAREGGGGGLYEERSGGNDFGIGLG